MEQGVQTDTSTDAPRSGVPAGEAQMVFGYDRGPAS